MFFSKFCFGVILALIMDVKGENCNGCSDTSSCVDFLVDDMIYGCYGTFSSGTVSNTALNHCGSGYHICESANEAQVLGLTLNDCQNKMPSGHSFWTLESSTNGNSECYSKYGDPSINTSPSNDIWACKSSQTFINNCGSIDTAQCGPFTGGCDSGYLNSNWQEDGIQMCNCDGTELLTISVIDDDVSGVLCCSDTIPNSFPSQCQESITVYSIRQGFSSLPNFAPFVGKYNYQGSDNPSEYPKYVHENNNGAEISISNFQTSDLVLKYTLGNYGTFWSNAISIETGFVIPNGLNKYKIIDSYFSPAGTSTSASLTNNDQITIIANGVSSLQLVAVFSDCPDYGLELTSFNPTTSPTDRPTNTPTYPTLSPTDKPSYSPTHPTLSPTIKPSNVPTNPTNNPTYYPTPPTLFPTKKPTDFPGGLVCPDYDTTTYANCNDDNNCDICQEWGCAMCKTGYYKMHNLQRCQSCVENYPNCAHCNDWNGCEICDSGYFLTWEQSCNDEICI